MRSWLSILSVIVTLFLLAACNGVESVETGVRPAMVAQPQPAAENYRVYPGEVRARYEPTLSFRIGGKLAARRVDVGDLVTAGQVLATLDPQDLGLEVAAASAQVERVAADVRLAEAEYQRFAEMHQRDLISDSALDARRRELDAARAQLKQARASADVASNQAEYGNLRATDAGVVEQVLVEPDQVVAAGQPVMRVAREGEREVAVAVPESEIDGFQVGMPVVVSLWGSDQRVPGTVRQLSPSADAAGRTFAARVAFPAEQTGARLGQSARVYVGSGTNSALAVPLPAVSAEGEAPFVYVVDDDDTVQTRPVRIGRFTEDRATITDGLAADDWVVIAGVHLLRDGQKVRPVDRDNRPVRG